ncbi:MAG TPA: sigma-54 dependent transcriptional regulator, partial [Myxococcota bacterium]
MNGKGTSRRALVADDSSATRARIAEVLAAHDLRAEAVDDADRALALVRSSGPYDLVLLDLGLGSGDGGVDLLRRVRAIDPAVPIVMLAAGGSARAIVAAMQAGANDLVAKPVDERELGAAIERALALAARARTKPAEPRRANADAPALWDSPSLARVRAVIEQIADTDVAVLISGESGSGKEVVAREIHRSSPRDAHPFVKVNCAALPGELLESELFGYEKGAFTGAAARRIGKFELAHGGTIFLDEIGEMSPSAQAKVLHVLQDRNFARVGGNREIHVDVRILSATHRPLTELVEQRRFREDLFFRLNVVNVHVPPLRERRDEIPALAKHFLARASERYARATPKPSARLLAALETHPFPGNVRELENLMKRMAVLGSEAPILRELAAKARGQGRRRFEDLLSEVEKSAGQLPLKEVGRRASVLAEADAISRVLDGTH